MEDLNVVDSINGAGSWLVANQALLLSYAVNIVAALAIIIVGLIIARMISNAVNRLMISRKIDATVADFLSALVRYGIIAFTLIAALGRVGVQTASVIAVLGAALDTRCHHVQHALCHNMFLPALNQSPALKFHRGLRKHASRPQVKSRWINHFHFLRYHSCPSLVNS